jgi:hypothetical protein
VRLNHVDGHRLLEVPKCDNAVLVARNYLSARFLSPCDVPYARLPLKLCHLLENLFLAGGSEIKDCDRAVFGSGYQPVAVGVQAHAADFGLGTNRHRTYQLKLALLRVEKYVSQRVTHRKQATRRDG